MEREVSIVVEIGVGLIALAALISIIWFTIYLGNDIADNVAIEASELSSDVSVGELDELCDEENIMPAASVYGLIRMYNAYVPEFVCMYCDKDINAVQDISGNTAPCILNHLSGKVNLQVERTDYGWYRFIVHYVDCNWYHGECTCDTLQAGKPDTPK